jgi:hypothetical protein
LFRLRALGCDGDGCREQDDAGLGEHGG